MSLELPTAEQEYRILYNECRGWQQEMAKSISELEATNAALWVCVRAAEALPPVSCHCASCRELANGFENALAALRPHRATDHGIPLPGEGVEG